MTFEQTVLLSALAGVTIFLGLPVGRLRNLSTRPRSMLTTAAAGVILFLIWDILSQAAEPVESASTRPATSGSSADVLTYASPWPPASPSGCCRSSTCRAACARIRMPRSILARSRSARRSASAFTTSRRAWRSVRRRRPGRPSWRSSWSSGSPCTTRPRASGSRRRSTTGALPSWGFLALVGVIGGGPTFVGGIVGYTLASPVLSIAFLGLAAGALIFVFNEMMAVARRASAPVAANVALLVGLLAAFATDFVLVAAGA